MSGEAKMLKKPAAFGACNRARRYSAIALFALSFTVIGGAFDAAVSAPSTDPGKTYGFVVRSWRTGLYESRFMDECPAGLNMGNDELWWRGLSKEDRVTKTENGMKEILSRWGMSIHRGPNGEDVCLDPTSVTDPPLRQAKGKISYGVNLDGTDDGHATETTCAHKKFTSPDGQPGVDNQMFRLLGCIEGWRWSFGQTEVNADETRHTSGLGMILIEVKGVHNLQNDDHVKVSFYRSIDQFAADSTGITMPFASYRIDTSNGKARYGDTLDGKIKDGVLTTEPGDVHLPFYGNYNYMQHLIRGARLQLKISPDGAVADGSVSGYYDASQITYYVEHMGAINSSAQVSCPMVHVAAYELADGYKDPKTGKCTALSTTFLIKTVGAFVIHPEGAGVVGSIKTNKDAPGTVMEAQAELK
jgi:hypothetical protein